MGKYIVYAKGYAPNNRLIEKGSYDSFQKARAKAYSLLKNDRNIEDISFGIVGDNILLGGVKRGDFIYERGRLFYYPDFWGKKTLGFKYNKYPLYKDGTLGKGI